MSDTSTTPLSIGERQMRIKNIFVEHDRFREAYEAISRFHIPVIGGVADAGSLAVIAGDSRTGKSFAARRYLKAHPSSIGERGEVLPVAYADMPFDGGVRGILEALAEPLRIKFSLRMSQPSLLAVIMKAFVDRKVELLLLDETQEVISRDNTRTLNLARKLIRKILNLGTLNVICIGLPETYDLIQKDPQLTGRGGLPYRMLRPYEWDSQEERQLFRLLCDEFDKALPFGVRSGLSNAAVAQRIYWVTHGNIGRLKDFLFAAGCLALNDDAERIEQRHFAEAYDQRKPPGTTFNPFVNDMSLAPAAARETAPPEAAGAQSSFVKKGVRRGVAAFQ